jgi:Tfp pilus assembly protein PilX
MMMRTDSCKQRGVTLVVTLIMLVLLTLFAVSAINSGMINLRIAGNMQSQDEARAAGQVAIERYISSLNNFQPPVGRTFNVDINNDGTTDFAVAVSQPKCIRAALQKPPRSTQCAQGEKSNLFCWDTIWEIEATAVDAKTGVSQVTVQGAAVSFGPDFIPSSAGC